MEVTLSWFPFQTTPEAAQGGSSMGKSDSLAIQVCLPTPNLLLCLLPLEPKKGALPSFKPLKEKKKVQTCPPVTDSH